MYLIIGKVDEHIEEYNGNKYLGFDSIDKNKEVLKKDWKLVLYGIKNEIQTINGSKKVNTIKFYKNWI